MNTAISLRIPRGRLQLKVKRDALSLGAVTDSDPVVFGYRPPYLHWLILHVNK